MNFICDTHFCSQNYRTNYHTSRQDQILGYAVTAVTLHAVTAVTLHAVTAVTLHAVRVVIVKCRSLKKGWD